MTVAAVKSRVAARDDRLFCMGMAIAGVITVLVVWCLRTTSKRVLARRRWARLSICTV